MERPTPVLVPQRRLRSVQRVERPVHVDEDLVGGHEPERAPTLDPFGADDPAYLREHRRQGRARVGRHTVAPHRLDELVPRDPPVEVGGQIAEQPGTLPSGETRLHPETVAVDREVTAELDADGPRQGFANLSPWLRQGSGCTLRGTGGTELPVSKEEAMSYIINCPDGVTVKGETHEELLDNA